MGYTIADSITRSRQIVQDLAIPYRHSDDKLLGYFNDALSDVRRLRPDYFIGTMNTPTFYDSSNLTDPFPIDYTIFTAITAFIAGMVGLEDDEFAQDGRAETLHNRFIVKLTGKFA